ncbi:GNAT family N-acetyltransferase [Kurthia sibirica]|uniref:N-acetyltransferase n=1 Tax=Kurthia sibirica TaxID=202750 RepID=A0A2U3API5_9BACL|nr:GNAT family N-acetyltransferase [Kurthia sibirica]PWI26447.1 N-acetyltransferase [Kurthia sibirica]GEK33014.1 hypothetical protein KSI01_05470 [Kurthia sibirica]
MRKIYLQKHDVYYAEKMAELLSAPEVSSALALQPYETTVDAMRDFIREMNLEEMMGNHISRMIMNEDFELIGVITLNNRNDHSKTCHISTWLGVAYWGLGYNTLAKEKMLFFAFTELRMHTVFAGARVENFRSRKAQRKLPYITLYAEKKYPDELLSLERRENAYCLLNAIEQVDFMKWYSQKIAI